MQPMSVAALSSRPVRRWHALLRALAVFDLALLGFAATAFGGAGSRLQLLLCAVYVGGCAFRSIWPVYDIPRLVMVDSRLSSVLVGRSVATIAELCFAGQWALALHQLALAGSSPLAQTCAWSIVPLIVVAEIFSWHAVLTTSQYGHVVENSLWGVSATLLVAGLLSIGPLRLAAVCPTAIIWCIGGATYVVFMFLVDVPMYWSRWQSDRVRGRRYFSLAQGLSDVSRRWSVSHRWEDWSSEVLWMSLYFSFGVWSSLSLVYASAVPGMQAR